MCPETVGDTTNSELPYVTFLNNSITKGNTCNPRHQTRKCAHGAFQCIFVWLVSCFKYPLATLALISRSLGLIAVSGPSRSCNSDINILLSYM